MPFFHEYRPHRFNTKAAVTVEQANGIIDEMQELVYEEVPYIQLGASLELIAFRSELQYTPGDGGFTLAGAWFK